MIDLIEKSLLTGIGVLALSQKKAEELATELKNRLDLSEEKGQELLRNLSEVARGNQQKLEDAARAEVRKVCADLGLVTRDELQRLTKKIAALEKELKELRRDSGTPTSGAC